MSRGDVLRSFLLQTARGAGESLRRLPQMARVEQLLRALAPLKAQLDDAALTAAVARVPLVSAASVRADGSALCVDASFENGARLSVRMVPLGFVCAPFGPKELSLSVQPLEALDDPRAREVAGAIAAAIVHALYRGLVAPIGRSELSAFVGRHGDRLVVDLRSVPALRRALAERARAIAIENLRPSQVEVQVGALHVRATLDALEALRRK